MGVPWIMVPLLNELNCLESCIEIYCCGYKYKTNTASECSNYVVVVVFGLNLWLLVNLMTEKYQFLTVVHFVFTFVWLKMIDCRVDVQSCWQKQIVLLCRSAKTFIPPYKDLCSILETPQLYVLQWEVPSAIAFYLLTSSSCHSLSLKTLTNLF